jgi:hypothetical protein
MDTAPANFNRRAFFRHLKCAANNKMESEIVVKHGRVYINGIEAAIQGKYFIAMENGLYKFYNLNKKGMRRVGDCLVCSHGYIIDGSVDRCPISLLSCVVHSTITRSVLLDMVRAGPSILGELDEGAKTLRKMLDLQLELTKAREMVKKAKEVIATMEADCAQLRSELARAEELAAAWECPVCFEGGGRVAIECGHSLCGECAGRVGACPICRAPIILTIVLH